jgi:hypothetical protein
MQYEIVFKSDRRFMLYLPFVLSRLLLELLGRRLLLVLLRWLDVYSRSSNIAHTYTHA